MNRHPMSVTSLISAPSSDHDLEHHPLDRRAVAVSVPGTVGTTVALKHAPSPDLPIPDMRVMVTMLNDAMCQVSLLRNEVSDLRRKLELKSDDRDILPSELQTSTIHVSVRTGPASAPGGVDALAERNDSAGRQNSFDWDAWQRDTKARIRRAMTYQTMSTGQALSTGAMGVGAE